MFPFKGKIDVRVTQTDRVALIPCRIVLCHIPLRQGICLAACVPSDGADLDAAARLQTPALRRSGVDDDNTAVVTGPEGNPYMSVGAHDITRPHLISVLPVRRFDILRPFSKTAFIKPLCDPGGVAHIAGLSFLCLQCVIEGPADKPGTVKSGIVILVVPAIRIIAVLRVCLCRIPVLLPVGEVLILALKESDPVRGYAE